jgi:Mce-associated membrane protein
MARIARLLRRVATLRGAVVGLAIALLVVAAVLAWQTRTLHEDAALDNKAQLDDANQERVIADVSRGLTQVLSYDYTQPEATRAFADQVLSGQAREEYDTLFASLEERAPNQKLTLSAEVQVAGVDDLTASTATLLVFIDQRSSREKDDEASVSAAQLSITAERVGDRWVITGLEPL